MFPPFNFFRYPAQVVQVDVTGRRFDRMSAARKSLLHVQHGLAMTEIETAGEDTVKRRSRSRKPRGKRRNTIAGTDQKEIEEVVGNVLVLKFIFIIQIKFMFFPYTYNVFLIFHLKNR